MSTQTATPQIFVTNSDTNMADFMPLTPGLTAGQLFRQQMQGKNTSDYLIRVAPPGGGAREAVSGDRILQPNESISFTPTKIQGA
jgi:hypothetical protein